MTNLKNSQEEICANCWRVTSNHRPWCAQYKTNPEPPKQGDLVDHPAFGPTELVSVYLRKDAIEDGVLVDCTQEPFDGLNREVGLIFDIAMTRAVFERYVEVPMQFAESQDLKGRYWDLVFMFKVAARLGMECHELLFELLCIPNGTGVLTNEKVAESPAHRLVSLKAVVHEGDRGEPCITFMLPSED
jgi:hypothetical protein